MCRRPLAYGHATATKIFLGFSDPLTGANDRESASGHLGSEGRSSEEGQGEQRDQLKSGQSARATVGWPATDGAHNTCGALRPSRIVDGRRPCHAVPYRGHHARGRQLLWLGSYCTVVCTPALRRFRGRDPQRLVRGWIASVEHRALLAVFGHSPHGLRRANLQPIGRCTRCGNRSGCRSGGRWLCGDRFGGRCSGSDRRLRSGRARSYRGSGRRLRTRCGRRLGCRGRAGGATRRKQFEWVDVALARADPDTEMNVREVVLRLAGWARLCNDIALHHAGTALNAEGSQMSEGRLVVARRDGHGEPVRRHASCKRHHTRNRRAYRRRRTEGDVDSSMLPSGVGVAADREPAQYGAVDRPRPRHCRRPRHERQDERRAEAHHPSRCPPSEHPSTVA